MLAQWTKEVLGYEFKNLRLLETALTHPSGSERGHDCNQRLEFLGDSLLGAVIAKVLYDRCPYDREGRLTRLRSNLVSKEACYRVALRIELAQVLLVGRGFPLENEVSLRRAIADALEAVIGAVFEDGGLDACRDLVFRLFAVELNRELAAQKTAEDARSVLQKLAEKKHRVKPEYRVLDENGTSHERRFLIAVQIRDREFPAAWGRSKSEARRFAAQLALEELERREAA